MSEFINTLSVILVIITIGVLLLATDITLFFLFVKKRPEIVFTKEFKRESTEQIVSKISGELNDRWRKNYKIYE